MIICSPFSYLLITRVQCLSFSLAHISFLVDPTKSILPGILMVYMAVKVSFTSSMFDTSRLVKLGRLS